MAYGFSLVNSNGRVIIKGDSPILTEIDRGTVSVTTPAGNNGIGYKGDSPVYTGYSAVYYAVKLPIGKWIHITREPGVLDSGISFQCPDAKTSVDFVAFARTNEVDRSNENYGFRLYNAQGVLVFDSGKRTFNVIKSRCISVRNEITFIFNDPGNSGWLIANCASINGFYTDGSGLYNVFTGIGIRRSSNGDYHTKGVPIFEVGAVEAGGRFKNITMSPTLVRLT